MESIFFKTHKERKEHFETGLLFWEAGLVYEAGRTLQKAGRLYKPLVKPISELQVVWTQTCNDFISREAGSVGLILDVIRNKIAFHFDGDALTDKVRAGLNFAPNGSFVKIDHPYVFHSQLANKQIMKWLLTHPKIWKGDRMPSTELERMGFLLKKIENFTWKLRELIVKMSERFAEVDNAT